MDTTLAKPGSRTRRRHSPEFKAQVIEACQQPGVSVAAVALANGLNANYLRRWINNERERVAGNQSKAGVVTTSPAKPTALVPVIVETPSLAESSEIRIDIRRGRTALQLAWPVGAAETLAPLLNELLR